MYKIKYAVEAEMQRELQKPEDTGSDTQSAGPSVQEDNNTGDENAQSVENHSKMPNQMLEATKQAGAKCTAAKGPKKRKTETKVSATNKKRIFGPYGTLL